MRDAGLADDARQAAWLSTAKSGRDVNGAEALRGRLYWAVKQFAFNARVTERRRAHRERVAAQREALPSTEQLVHRNEQRQRVWAALMELPEPLRGTLVLHFQDGLSPGEIAERAGTKADTVRRRIQRGVEQLRQRLGADRGGGGVLALAAAIPRGRADAAGRGGLVASASHVATLSIGATMLVKLLVAVGAVTALIFTVRGLVRPEVAGVPEEVALAALEDENLRTLQTDPQLAGTTTFLAHAADSSKEAGPGRAQQEASPAVASWSGSVIIHDGQGKVLPAERTGTFSASISLPMRPGSLHDSGAIRAEIPFRSGRFEVAVTENAEANWGCWNLGARSEVHPGGAPASDLVLLVMGAETAGLGPLVQMESGTSTTVRPNGRIAFGKEGVVLHFRSIEPIVVHVVDGMEEDVHLEQVDIEVGASGTDRPEITNTRRRTRLALAQDSPITLQPEIKQASWQIVGCFFHSPGYARKRVELDLTTGGERTVRLEPGGDLHVVLHGTWPRKSYLRVYVNEERWAPFSDLGVRDTAEWELTGLPVGPAKVRLEKGSFFGEPILLAEEAVVIQKGARASLSMVSREFMPATSVNVAGELLLPDDWDAKESRLRIQRVSPSTGGEDESSYLDVGDVEASEHSPELYPFSAGRLIPGDYVATVEPMEFKTAFTVPPEGLSDLRLEVPPSVHIRVTVRDSETGCVSDLVKSLSWLPAYDGPSGFTAYPSAGRDEATQAFALEVPRGPIEISASARGVTHARTTVQAVEGLAVELEVTRVALARVELEYRGRQVPWPSDAPWELPCERMDGVGEVLSRGNTRAGIRFSVTAPGRYRLTLPRPEGFKQPEPVEIDLAIEEERRVVVKLTADSLGDQEASASSGDR